MGKKKGMDSTAASGFKKTKTESWSDPKQGTTQNDFAPKPKFVEIPANLNALSIRELKYAPPH